MCFLCVALAFVLPSCSKDGEVDKKYEQCAGYRVVSERELPLAKCDESRLIGKLQDLLGVPATGKFDVATAIAVESFQLNEGLAISAMIDIDTINRLSEKFENGANGSACLFNISQPSRPWKKCDYNNEMIPFQRFMGIEADGFVGPGTVKAIIVFQNQNGLEESGEIDESTWNAYLDIAEGN
jgi:peptidoglycan hydrolase-like protein with peptidoglycan-binding domain